MCRFGLLLALAGCHNDDSAHAVGDAVADPSAASAAAPAAAASKAPPPAGAMPAPPVAQPVKRGAVPDPGYLAGESRLLSGNMLSSGSAETVLRSRKGFEEALRQFEQDAARHPDAQDLSALYRAAATRALGADTALASLWCGYSLCMGEVQSRSREGFADWVRAFRQDHGAPYYALMTAEYPLGQGQSAGRFVFSVDPAANGISTP
ncbi:hypothetical protein C1924_11245 [Stenotrophomonas sp. ESTM1D_MKCIP4_1]|nr:hypothetical protein C1924_11245 [Stenotrophomonas sp. ESTM1D_MKCIP4_1]